MTEDIQRQIAESAKRVAAVSQGLNERLAVGERQERYEDAMEEAGALNVHFRRLAAKAAMAVADAEYDAEYDTEFGALRADNARLRAELDKSNSAALSLYSTIERVHAVLDDTEHRGWVTAMIPDIRAALEDK
ncbi:hypothetical protein [Streptomyces sp. NBC_01197]|uniref:hypothetical protein n=1 Tax=Streptomyces sp. NBC_01197 TaxID=2903768 RepID=UPI002E1468C5|nr:hypothetical protein OG452_05155 [Streptomyces sp. NBC_01197]